MHVRPFIIMLLFSAVLVPAAISARAAPPLAGEWRAQSPSTVRLVLTAKMPNRLEGQFVSTSGTTWTVKGTVDGLGAITLARYIPITELGNIPPRARRSLLRVPEYRDADTPADHLRGKVEFTYDFQNDTISSRYSLIAVQYDTEEDLLLEHSEQWVDMALTRAFEGSFATTRAQLPGQTGNNRIEIAFTPAAGGGGQLPAGQNPWRTRTGCQDLCLVSVFHVQDANGRIVIPPSTAYGDDFEPALFGGLAAHAGGYIVDTPLKSMLSGQPIRRPCMPTMTTVPARITAEDQPNFVKPGYTAQFETNLVCLDARPITIYAKSLRWVFNPTPPAATRITRSGASIDHAGPTAAFRTAVEAWLPLHGQ